MNEVQQIAATVLGIVLILAGLALIVLRRDSATNHVKLWNIEVNLSTPALVVLIAGCGLFALPLFAEHKGSPWTIFRLAGESGGASTTNPLRTKQEVVQTEAEPNDAPTLANIIPYGVAVEGEVGNGDVDYFVVNVPEDQKGRSRIIVRQVSNPRYRTVRLFDADETQIYDALSSSTVSRGVSPSRLYMIAIEKEPSKSNPGGDIQKYEVLVRPEDEPVPN